MKRYTWTGGDLSAEVALGLTVELWDWLADNPDMEKWDWPRWKSNGGDVAYVEADCVLCEYMDKSTTSCSGACLLWGKWAALTKRDKCHCMDKDSLFRLWDSTPKEERSARTAYARMIADRACDELRKLRKGGKA